MKAVKATLALLVLAGPLVAGDWTQFRGANGSGISPDGKPPTTWDEKKNIRWTAPLPGPGSSSPVVVGNKVFVTCYTGFGIPGGEGGDPKDLKRHLLCLDRSGGKVLWSKTVDALLPEFAYRGPGVTEHGYSSHTPVSDGEHVYAFFGKSGVSCYDLEGKELWHVSVGTETNGSFGTAASPILYKDLLIVNAAAESQSLRALDKKTGKEKWKAEASSFYHCFTTPALVKTGEGKDELVVSVIGETWGFDPNDGKLLWYAANEISSSACPIPVSGEGVVYVFGGRGRGGQAIRAGGKDDVGRSHVVWDGKTSAYVPSPVLREGHLYWVDDRGNARCINAKTGEEVYNERLPIRGGGGGFRSPVYASVVLADGKLYAVTRTGGTFVLAARPKFEQLAHNTISSDRSIFNGSPAIADKQLFLRSDSALYCIEEK